MKGWQDWQLAFDLQGIEAEALEGDERPVLQPHEARQISEAARMQFAALGRAEEGPVYFADYVRLAEQGWPWRVAAYMAWAAAPKDQRSPKSIDELARLLGLTSARRIYEWRRKYPAIDGIVGMLVAAPLLEHRRDVLEALVTVAKQADYKGFNDRRLFLEMTGLYTPRAQLEARLATRRMDVSELSDEELEALAGLRGQQSANVDMEAGAASTMIDGVSTDVDDLSTSAGALSLIVDGWTEERPGVVFEQGEGDEE